jgi:hypothetical protein
MKYDEAKIYAHKNNMKCSHILERHVSYTDAKFEASHYIDAVTGLPEQKIEICMLAHTIFPVKS